MLYLDLHIILKQIEIMTATTVRPNVMYNQLTINQKINCKSNLTETRFFGLVRTSFSKQPKF
jgi:hypothetical protein